MHVSEKADEKLSTSDKFKKILFISNIGNTKISLMLYSYFLQVFFRRFDIVEETVTKIIISLTRGGGF